MFFYTASDGESSSSKVGAYKKTKFIWQAAVSAFLLLGVTFPQGTQAVGLYNLFKSSVAYAESSILSFAPQSLEYNSQNLPVLEAVGTTDYRLATGGAEIKIEDGLSLTPQNSVFETGAPHTNQNPDAVKIYVVQKGDTLSEIAEKFGVSVNTIRWANDLGRNGLIKVGQELVILPVNGVRYKVKRGGTLRDIVKKIGGNLEEAAAFNNLGPDEELEAGTEVVIPEAELKEPKKKARRFAQSTIRRFSKALPEYKGYFMRPVIGGVRTQGLHGKNAVDLASYYGAPIYAAADGTVLISKWGAWNGGYGNYVVIQHPNGAQTLYAHLSQNLVKKGEYVRKGQVIGKMGSTGRSTGVHLHFEIRGAKNPF